MNLKFSDWLIFLVFGCLTFFHFRGFYTGSGSDFLKKKWLSLSDSSSFALEDERKWLLFILDFHDFSCMTCLDSFLGLYEKLPFRLKTSNAWGILVIRNSEVHENNLVRIAEKKLKGFVQANQILSPFLVDRFQVFRGMAEEGSCVVLFDGAQRIIHKYDFPLRGEEFEEIFKFLIE
jgi:hypothetical protein